MKNSDIDLRGKTAIITGGARGLGKEIAALYAEHGARVALADIREKELAATAEQLRSAGHAVLPVRTDITEPAEVEAMTAAVLAEWKTIDILVNNAATFSHIGPVWEAPADKWFGDLKVNLYGSFLCCRAVVRHLVERRRGYVINTVSSGGTGDPHPYCTSYAVSKTGLMRLTEGLAREAGEHNVKVFALAPPAVLTDMTRFILEDKGGKKWRPRFGEIFAEKKDFPARAVAETALHLVSGAADRLSGRFIEVAEGLEHILERQDRVLEDDLLTLRITGRHKP